MQKKYHKRQYKVQMMRQSTKRKSNGSPSIKLVWTHMTRKGK